MSTEWHQRWEEGRIGFHLSSVNPTLKNHLDKLCEGPARVFVPLAGKSLDLRFLAEAGHQPIGVELVEKAVQDFFAEHALTAEVSDISSHKKWSGGGVDLHVADIFHLEPDAIGHMDAVWDRAALVALPPDVRPRYAQKILSLLRPGGRMLLVTFAYDQSRLDGPPYSVPDDEVRALYGSAGELSRLEHGEVDASPRARESGVSFTESVWLFVRR